MIIDQPNQTSLYGMTSYFNHIKNLYDANILPNKILLTGQPGLSKTTLAYHLINYFFSKNEEFPYDIANNQINEKNKSFKLVCNNSHPNFHLIKIFDEKKNIEISQIRKMIEFTNKSSFNNNKKFVLIENSENLNIYSQNALLKAIEEPNNNVNYLLIHNNSRNILDTLKSRCLIFKINLSYQKKIEIINKLINDDVFNYLSKDLINYYCSPGDLLSLINFSKENKINLVNITLKEFLIFLIDNDYYKKDTFIKTSIYSFIEDYFFKIYYKSLNKNKVLLSYSKFIHKINNTHKYNLDVESLLMEIKSELLYG